jgi:hypothetical protein
MVQLGSELHCEEFAEVVTLFILFTFPSRVIRKVS